jgi:hypothetical protein
MCELKYAPYICSVWVQLLLRTQALCRFRYCCELLINAESVRYLSHTILSARNQNKYLVRNCLKIFCSSYLIFTEINNNYLQCQITLRYGKGERTIYIVLIEKQVHSIREICLILSREFPQKDFSIKFCIVSWEEDVTQEVQGEDNLIFDDETVWKAQPLQMKMMSNHPFIFEKCNLPEYFWF